MLVSIKVNVEGKKASEEKKAQRESNKGRIITEVIESRRHKINCQLNANLEKKVGDLKEDEHYHVAKTQPNVGKNDE